MVISKKTIIFKGFREGPTFSRGEGNFFHGGGGGGVQWVISIETHITCDFPGGGGGGGADPISPLWIRTCDFTTYLSYFKRKH